MPNKPYRVRVLSGGRITIPAPLRKKYGIRGGSKVAFEMNAAGGFVLLPIQAQRAR